MPINTDVCLLQMRRTKIVATLGPTSSTPETIRDLMHSGVNVFRLNMSHGDHEAHKKTYRIVRQIAEEEGKTIGILADLCGPKIRTGRFKEGQITLEPNEKVTITTRDVFGEKGLIPSQYEALAEDVKVGNRILFNDGALEVRVDDVQGKEISCTVLRGGVLKDHKGINLPGVPLSTPSLTEKDKLDAKFALDLGVDFLALSFVRRATDIYELKALISEEWKEAEVIAKIEKPEALLEASKIVEASDGIMVARGDLGVELDPEQVPVIQSELIQLARTKHKPVIVATQMLESMIEHSRPTRAEVTDISYAVTLGTDAVMLSAETASGLFPVESVRMMDRIIRQTEAHLFSRGTYGNPIERGSVKEAVPVWDAVSNTTARLSKSLKAQAVLVTTNSGMSAATMSSARPAAPVLAITERAAICRKMSLLWSVIPVLVDDMKPTELIELARSVTKRLNIGNPGEHVLLVRGFHGNPLLNCPSVTVIPL